MMRNYYVAIVSDQNQGRFLDLMRYPAQAHDLIRYQAQVHDLVRYPVRESMRHLMTCIINERHLINISFVVHH
jgi:hypothetical protein